MSDTTTTSTGVYTTTKTQFSGLSSLREMYEHQRQAEQAGRPPIGGELDAQEALLIGLLREFGHTVTWPADPWPPNTELRPEFIGLRLTWWGALTKTPNQVEKDPELNAIINERAIVAMNELAFLRGAMDTRNAAAIGWHGRRFGDFMGRLRVAPHEPDTQLGRAVRKQTSQGGKKRAENQKTRSENLRRQILELNKKKLARFPVKSERMGEIQEALEKQGLKASIRTIERALRTVTS